MSKNVKIEYKKILINIDSNIYNYLKKYVKKAYNRSVTNFIEWKIIEFCREQKKEDNIF